MFVKDGGLMPNGPDADDGFRDAANFVDRILKGAKAADLPAQQPTRYYLTINRTTAAALGLTIPQSLLARADDVIPQCQQHHARLSIACGAQPVDVDPVRRCHQRRLALRPSRGLPNA